MPHVGKSYSSEVLDLSQREGLAVAGAGVAQRMGTPQHLPPQYLVIFSEV